MQLTTLRRLPWNDDGDDDDDSDCSDWKYLLRFSLVRPLTLVVDATEVWDDHRHWQSNDKYSTQRTHSADHFADHRVRHHVSVPATTGTMQ